MRILILLLFLSTPAFAEDVRQVTVQVGSNTMIAQPQHYQLDCKLQPVFVTPLLLPTTGQLQITRALYRIGDFGPGRAIRQDSKHRCLGRFAWGPQIRYVAGKKAGTDKLQFHVKFHTGDSATVTYEMTVVDP